MIFHGTCDNHDALSFGWDKKLLVTCVVYKRRKRTKCTDKKKKGSPWCSWSDHHIGAIKEWVSYFKNRAPYTLQEKILSALIRPLGVQ